LNYYLISDGEMIGGWLLITYKIRGNIEAPCVKTIKKEPRGNNSSGLSLSRFLLDNERFSAGQAHGTKEELFLFVVL